MLLKSTEVLIVHGNCIMRLVAQEKHPLRRQVFIHLELHDDTLSGNGQNPLMRQLGRIGNRRVDRFVGERRLVETMIRVPFMQAFP